MRLVTLRTPDGTRAARIDGDEAVELPFVDVGALLREESWMRVGEVRAGAIRHPLEKVDLAPVVPHPGKIVCLGLNYAAHIQEMGRELPRHPTLFAKYSNSLVGPRDPIVLPAQSMQPDWEVELMVIIGTRLRHASETQAAAGIAGFTVCNDISMRDFQNRTTEWLQGKTWDSTFPVGPALVTPDELGGVSPDLEIRLDVNGEEMQAARTGDLVFGPVDTLVYVSQILSLEPGDVIALGTPGGVGSARQPPRYLRPDDIVTAQIEQLGACVNRCIPATSALRAGGGGSQPRATARPRRE